MTEREGTNILEVDPDQDLTDLVYRLREGSDDTALVVPPGAPLFQKDETFQVLKRQALSIGRQIAVITTDADIQARARAAGLPAFVDRESYEAAAVAASPAPVVQRRARPRPSRRLDWRLAAASLGVLLIASIVAAVLLPTATISLSVAGSPVKAEASLVGSPGIYDATFLSFNTRTLSASASDGQSAPVTSQQTIPAVSATGEVVLTATNCSSPITLASGTIVETANQKQFALKSTVTLCLASGPSATTTVSAVLAGSAGNIPAYSLTTVDGAPGVSPTNANAFTGGADTRTATVVQQSEVDSLRQQVIARVDAMVRSQLKTLAGMLHVIPSAYPQISSSISPPVGSEGNTVSVSVTEVLKAVAFSDHDVHARLRDAIRVRVPPGYALTGDPIKTWYEVTEANEDGHVVLSGHGLAYAMPVFDAHALAKAIAGQTLGAARQRLRALPTVVRVDVRQQPVPLPWLPLQASHVSIQVLEAAVSPS